MAELSVRPAEKGTIFLPATLTLGGIPLVPITLAWTLKNLAGAVVNSRENIEIGSPTSEIEIALSGDDLAVNETNGDDGRRVLTLSGTFYSAQHQASFPLVSQLFFTIEDLLGI